MDEVGRAHRAEMVRDVPVAQQRAVAVAGYLDVPVGDVDARNHAVLQHDAAYAPLAVEGMGMVGRDTEAEPSVIRRL